jgi:hypothetical protein
MKINLFFASSVMAAAKSFLKYYKAGKFNE